MRYHFHVVNDEVSLNVDIAELPNYEAAVAHSRMLAQELLKRSPYSDDPRAWEISVTDESGEEVLALPLAGP